MVLWQRLAHERLGVAGHRIGPKTGDGRLEQQREGGPASVGQEGPVTGDSIVDHPHLRHFRSKVVERSGHVGLFRGNVVTWRSLYHQDRRRVVAPVVVGGQDLLGRDVTGLAREGKIDRQAVAYMAGGEGADDEDHRPGGDDQLAVPENGVRQPTQERRSRGGFMGLHRVGWAGHGAHS